MKCVCCQKTTDKSEGVCRSLHRFPTTRPQELQAWLKNAQLQANDVRLGHLRLCSEHFSKECFVITHGAVTLRRGSIPTLFNSTACQRICSYCKVSRTKEGDRMFHKFPLKMPMHLGKWLSAIPLANFCPTKNDMLCSDHFEPWCFRWGGNGLRLKPLAVPTVFMPVIFAESNVSSSQMVVTASTSRENPETVYTKMEATTHSQGAADIVAAVKMDITSDSKQDIKLEYTEMESTIAVDCSIDMPSTPTTSCWQQKPNIRASVVMVQHDHCYYTSSRSLKKQLVSAHNKIKKYEEECKANRKRIKRLTTQVTSLKDVVCKLRKKKTK